MKKVILTAASLLLAIASLRAQAPARFNYQGIARSASGTVVANQALGMRISILDGSSTGTAVYTETQTATTNAYGLYTLAIGGGTPTTGSLSTVNWASGDKYVKVEIDPAGGNNYTTTGTAQLLSVPYALYAGGGVSATGGTANYLPKFTGATALGNSTVFETTTGKLGIGTTTPVGKMDITTTDTMALHLASSSTTGARGGILQVEYTGTTTSTPSVGIYSEVLPSATIGSGIGAFNVGGNVGTRSQGQANTTTGDVFGSYSESYSQGNAYGTYNVADNFTGVNAGTKYAVTGFADGGTVNVGIFGATGGSTGVTNYAGYFNGSVQVVGSLAKSAGTFKIDHPQDPANKYLYHSFVESPDMMNVYNGNATTDASGYVTVTLPGYFETLNKDFRYQLTVMGQTFAQAIVSQKVQGNQFQIRTNQPNVEVSWQVTGIRNDAYAQAHRVQAEVTKEAENKGKYLNPVELGQPASLQINATPTPQQPMNRVPAKRKN